MTPTSRIPVRIWLFPCSRATFARWKVSSFPLMTPTVDNVFDNVFFATSDLSHKQVNVVTQPILPHGMRHKKPTKKITVTQETPQRSLRPRSQEVKYTFGEKNLETEGEPDVMDLPDARSVSSRGSGSVVNDRPVRIPNGLSILFQERISNFAIYMLLLLIKSVRYDRILSTASSLSGLSKSFG
jgi:hypothetical protein